MAYRDFAHRTQVFRTPEYRRMVSEWATNKAPVPLSVFQEAYGKAYWDRSGKSEAPGRTETSRRAFTSGSIGSKSWCRFRIKAINDRILPLAHYGLKPWVISSSPTLPMKSPFWLSRSSIVAEVLGSSQPSCAEESRQLPGIFNPFFSIEARSLGFGARSL